MAMHIIDRKILSAFARENEDANVTFSSALYRILGLSRMLSKRIVHARKLRKLSPTSEKDMNIYHHIIWLAREGLSIVEDIIVPFAESNQFGVEIRVFAYKLRASFYHIFCLFHNRPAVSPLNPAHHLAPKQEAPTVLLPVPEDSQTKDEPSPPGHEQSEQPSTQRARPHLREPVISMLSDSSNVTNPYGSLSALSPPPGLPPKDQTQIPDPAAFLLPSTNFIPMTIQSFNNAASVASAWLSGSSPIRLSIGLENCAFHWDCLHDHAGSRKLAEKTIDDVFLAQEGMDDEEFADAANFVNTLGRMAKRQSQDTLKSTQASPSSSTTSKHRDVPPEGTPPPVPGVPAKHMTAAPDPASGDAYVNPPLGRDKSLPPSPPKETLVKPPTRSRRRHLPRAKKLTERLRRLGF